MLAASPHPQLSVLELYTGKPIFWILNPLGRLYIEKSYYLLHPRSTNFVSSYVKWNLTNPVILMCVRESPSPTWSEPLKTTAHIYILFKESNVKEITMSYKKEKKKENLGPLWDKTMCFTVFSFRVFPWHQQIRSFVSSKRTWCLEKVLSGDTSTETRVFFCFPGSLNISSGAQIKIEAMSKIIHL